VLPRAAAMVEISDPDLNKEIDTMDNAQYGARP
jgi:hypothetical protein